MSQCDVVVIGGGFAGLMAALASAGQGQRVTVLAEGSGSFAVNSGLIDVLAYDGEHEFLASPLEGIKNLPPHHPYQKIGLEYLKDSVNFFLETMAQYGFSYEGNLRKQILVPTALGTVKPTCLAPKSLKAPDIGKQEKIMVVGIKNLKDFYADMVAENLKGNPLVEGNVSSVEIDTEIRSTRDLTTLDIARYLDNPQAQEKFIEKLKVYSEYATLFIVPQILGSRGGQAAEKMASSLGVPLVETTCLPPSVNGLRLEQTLLGALRDKGAELIRGAKAIGAETEGDLCLGVKVRTGGREKIYRGKKFILATGGFYSGGLLAESFDTVREVVFGLPVKMDTGEEKWSNPKLFENTPQGFAMAGIETGENLRPTDSFGKEIFRNVYIAGRNLADYDFCFECSGNGVALASAYKCAML